MASGSRSMDGKRFGVIAAALIAGLVAGLLGENGYVQVKAKVVAGEVLGNPMMGTTTATEQAAVKQRAAREYGILGLVLGLATALAATKLPGASGKTVPGIAIAAVLGAASASLFSMMAVPLFFKLRGRTEVDLIPSMAVHAAIWMPMALGIGLGFGLVTGARGRLLIQTCVSAAIGALIGTVAYEMIGAALLASDETGEPIASTAVARIAATAIVGLFVGVGLAVAPRLDSTGGTPAAGAD